MLRTATKTTKRSSRRGSHVIEFALTFPVLIALLAGVMEYGWYYSRQMAMTGAVRDAARVGSMTAQHGEVSIEKIAEAKVLASLMEQGYRGEVYLDVSVGGTFPNEYVHVGVAIPHRPLMGLVPVPGKVKSSLSMRLEDQQG